jgi:hypothetical protein
MRLLAARSALLLERTGNHRCHGRAPVSLSCFYVQNRFVSVQSQSVLFTMLSEYKSIIYTFCAAMQEQRYIENCSELFSLRTLLHIQSLTL